MDGQKKIYGFYSDVSERDVEWLWYPYIPYGKLTLVQGDPGEGKSTFVIHLISLLTRGKQLPDGYRISGPHTVVYQCNEDDIADTIKPRLIAAGADCDRVAYIRDDDDPLTVNDDRIEKTISALGAKLFVLDPLQSFLSQDGDMHSVGRMRSALSKLAAVAARYECAVVIIGHMNKSYGGKDLYRGLGSIDIAAIARSVLMVGRDQDDPDVRYVMQIKANLAPQGDSIGFRFDRKKGFTWLGKCSPNIASEGETVGSFFGKSSDAADMISSLLRDGPVASSDIMEKMTRRGISDRTVYKVKKELGISSYKSGALWYWTYDDVEKKE